MKIQRVDFLGCNRLSYINSHHTRKENARMVTVTYGSELWHQTSVFAALRVPSSAGLKFSYKRPKTNFSLANTRAKIPVRMVPLKTMVDHLLSLIGISLIGIKLPITTGHV